MSRTGGFLWLGAIALVALLLWFVGEALKREAVEAPKGETRQVQFPWGGNLAVPVHPQRILPANAGAADLVSALVSPERIVALPAQAFTWSRIAIEPEGFRLHPRFARFLAETVLAYDPDLVLVDGINAPDTCARLRKLGVPVVTLPSTYRIEKILSLITTLGDILDAEERAASLVDSLSSRIEALKQTAGGRGKLRVITYSNYGSTGIVGGAGTTNAELLRLCGVKNAALEIGKMGSARLSFEELLGLDPDLIVVDEGQAPARSSSRAVLEDTPALSGLRALKRGHIIELPVRLLSTTSHELLSAAELLSQRIDAVMKTPK